MQVSIEMTQKQDNKWLRAEIRHRPQKCAPDCMCVPDPQFVELHPGERVQFGWTRGYDKIWATCGGRSIVSVSSPTFMHLRKFRDLLDALFRKMVHLPKQHKKTQMWATEQLLEVPDIYGGLIP